jgi:hypothetical protein
MITLKNVFAFTLITVGSLGLAISPFNLGTDLFSAHGRFDSIALAATDCTIDSNLTLTAQDFIGKCCKGSVKAEFPGELLANTVQDIRDNKSKNASYKTAWKLISRSEYRK